MSLARIAGAQPEVEDPRKERRVDHDVRRFQVAVLDAESMRVMDRVAHLSEDAGALRELERRADPSELEPLDVLHHDEGGIPLAELEDADDAPVGEEGHRPRFLEEPGDAGQAPIAADDLAGHDPIEREVLELVDLAHAAAAEALDGLEAVEHGQRRGAARPPPRRQTPRSATRSATGSDRRARAAARTRSGRPAHNGSSGSCSPCSTWCSTKRASRSSRSVAEA